MAETAVVGPEAIALDPEWQPFAYQANGDRLSFVHLPRSAQQKLIFIDRRHVSSQMAGPMPASAIPRDLVRSRAGPAHFVFHTAFCCSTLMARAFDLPGASMGLKEPEILISFTDALEAHGQSFEYHSSLGLAVDLLSRPLAPGETQIIKPTNLANPIAPCLLDARPDARAIVMHAPLETYLRTTSKKELAGRSFNREALMQLRPFMSLHPDMIDQVIMRLTDLEVAAVVWLMQVRFFQDVIRRFGSARVRTLSSETLLAAPTETLRRTGDFFSVAPPGDTSWETIAAGPVFKQHAKTSGRAYSTQDRQADLEAAGRAHAREIAEVMDWAAGLAQKLGGVAPLGDTLLDAVAPAAAQTSPNVSAVQPAAQAHS